jgi:hypothetical protein
VKSKTYVARKKILIDTELMKPVVEQRWYDLHGHRRHLGLHE